MTATSLQAPKVTIERPRLAVLVGVVRAHALDKTIKVEVARSRPHAKYGKYLRRRTVLQVHDPLNTARTGDTVEIMPCRRISKTKSWRLVRVVRPSVEAAAAE